MNTKSKVLQSQQPESGLYKIVSHKLLLNVLTLKAKLCKIGKVLQG